MNVLRGQPSCKILVLGVQIFQNIRTGGVPIFQDQGVLLEEAKFFVTELSQ